MSRLSRDDWAGAALDALSGGLGAVAVEPLAARLGATKGSFYWHFRNRDELIAAALQLGGSTTAVIERLEAGNGTARQRLRELFSLVFAPQARTGADLALLADANTRWSPPPSRTSPSCASGTSPSSSSSSAPADQAPAGGPCSPTAPTSATCNCAAALPTCCQPGRPRAATPTRHSKPCSAGSRAGSPTRRAALVSRASATAAGAAPQRRRLTR